MLFLAHSLAVGGAERQLVNLAKGLHTRGHTVVIAVLRPGRGFEDELRSAGISIVDLQGKSYSWSPIIVFRLIGAIRRLKPAVVYSYLSLPNVLSALVRPMIRATRIAWGVRASFVDYRGSRLRFRVADALEQKLAFLPDMIICNSAAGKRLAIAKGYPQSRLVVIPNGIDTDRFKPSRAGRERVRHEWKVAMGERVVGIVGRLEPMKDHATFLRAAAVLKQRMPVTKFVCVGRDEAGWRARMQQLAVELGIHSHVIWSEERADMPDVYSALDVLCLTSRGEGFPNVIGEAMACDTPCVATDVGDVSRVIGDAGIVVARENPAALADAVESVLARPGGTGSSRMSPRSRIVERFSVSALCDATEAMLFGGNKSKEACA